MIIELPAGYIQPTNYTLRVVAFIDIMGFKELINFQDENGYKFFRKIHSSLVYLYQAGNHPLLQEPYDDGIDITITAGSDSLIMSYPVNNNIGKNLEELISRLNMLQLAFYPHDILLRGAVCIEYFHHEKINGIPDIFYGPGFLKSYNLEQLARYNRILFDTESFNQNGIDLSTFNLEKTDEYYYLNFYQHLKTQAFYQGLSQYDAMLRNKDYIADILNDKNVSDKLKEKYEWSKIEYNKMAKYVNDLKDGDDRRFLPAQLLEHLPFID